MLVALIPSATMNSLTGSQGLHRAAKFLYPLLLAVVVSLNGCALFSPKPRGCVVLMNTDSNPLPQVEVSADGDRMLGYFMASGERISLETKSALLMSTLRVNWTDRVGVRHIAELPVQPLLSRRQADGLVLEVKDMHLTVHSTTKCYEPHAKQDVLYSRFVN